MRSVNPKARFSLILRPEISRSRVCSTREDFGRRRHGATFAMDSCRGQVVYDLPFADLLFQAQSVHRQSFDPNTVQRSQLLNIKTGGCSEDCSYCSQSVHHPSGLEASKLMDVEDVISAARRAREGGATRYRMGAAWRGPKPRDMGRLTAMVRGVKALEMETCMTLGMLSSDDEDLTGTDLQNRFYQYLAKWNALQAIIIENTSPPDGVASRPSTVFFSKNPHQGRHGLFPMVAIGGPT